MHSPINAHALVLRNTTRASAEASGAKSTAPSHSRTPSTVSATFYYRTKSLALGDVHPATKDMLTKTPMPFGVVI